MPRLIRTQVVQHGGQAVIAEVERPHGSPHACLQGRQPLRDPRLDVAQAVIGFREDESQPPTRHLAQAQALPVPMGGEVGIQQRGHLHLLQLGQQHGNVIYTLMGYTQLFAHPASLPAILKSTSPFERTMSETYEDLLKAGIIDPTKVVRTALQNAASVAGLLLTTEAIVAEKPEEKNAQPPMLAGDF